LDCSALTSSCAIGFCDPRTGACASQIFPDGFPCSDGDLCTSPDSCQMGQCLGQISPNLSCDSPVPIPIITGSTTIAGSLACGVDQQQGSCAAPGSSEVAFEFRVISPVRVVIHARSTDFPPVVSLRQNCRAPASELACASDVIDQVLAPGAYAALVESAAPGGAGAFTLSVTFVSPDTCSGAAVLPTPAPGTSVQVQGDTTGLGDDFQAACAGGAASPDQVYVMTVTQPGHFIFRTLPLGGQPNYDTALYLGPAPCMPGFVSSLACDDDSGGGTLSRFELDLSPGTYFVYVDGWANQSQGPYTLEVSQTTMTASQQFIFPEVGDARLIQVGNLFSRSGDFVEGIRTPAFPTVSQLDVDLQLGMGANQLMCDTLFVSVLLNGINVGNFTVSPGQTQIQQHFNFMPILGPSYSIRYQVLFDVQMGCGGVRMPPPPRGSTITLTQ